MSPSLQDWTVCLQKTKAYVLVCSGLLYGVTDTDIAVSSQCLRIKSKRGVCDGRKLKAGVHIVDENDLL